jgi:hypothetical protein
MGRCRCRSSLLYSVTFSRTWPTASPRTKPRQRWRHNLQHLPLPTCYLLCENLQTSNTTASNLLPWQNLIPSPLLTQISVTKKKRSLDWTRDVAIEKKGYHQLFLHNADGRSAQQNWFKSSIEIGSQKHKTNKKQTTLKLELKLKQKLKLKLKLKLNKQTQTHTWRKLHVTWCDGRRGWSHAQKNNAGIW